MENTKLRKTNVRNQCAKLKVKAFKILAKKALEDQDISACEALISLAEQKQEESAENE